MQLNGLTSLTLKIIASLTMLIDHVGLLFFPDVTVLREIGRLAFPLFAFLLAEGMLKTRNKQNYVIRLAIFAIISQIPYSFMLYVAGVWPIELNIFFLLTLGAIMLAALSRVRWLPLRLLVVIFTVVLAEVTSISYGGYGILIILACYLFLKKLIWAGTTLFVAATVIATTVIPKFSWVQLFALCSLPFMAAYNGQLGKQVSRWLFYWFYPAHMLILSFIGWAMQQ